MGDPKEQALKNEQPSTNHRDPWRHRSAGMRCRTCMWFVLKSEDGRSIRREGGIGRCRRRSPTMGGFPVVFEADWCGDHKLDETKL
jgi:hypothetical protein